MSIVKTYNQQVDAYGGSDVVQALTSTGTTVNRHGVTTITASSAGTAQFAIQGPTAGVRKTIIVDPNSTEDVVVVNQTTSVTFFGTTANIATFSTGAGVKSLELVGLSTTSWAVVSKTTGVTLTGSTLSA